MVRETEQRDWRQHRILEFRKTIYVAVWDEATRGRALSYWQSRGFQFSAPTGEDQTGRRGSMWGNLSSFDMSKLISKLTVTHMGGDEITFALEIDIAYQVITPWNRAYWQFELDRAADFVLYGDNRRDLWQIFEKQWRLADWHWILPWRVKQPPTYQDDRFENP